MNWDDLRIFLSVARTGSISGAARSLKVQHSTISRRMRKMEEKYGARLIERKKSGYELTSAGELVKEAAMRMETEALSVDGAVVGNDSNLVGSLRVATINNLGATILMPIFARFSKTYPRINLQIMVSNADHSLVEREADVAIRLTNSPTDTLIGKRVGTVVSTIYGSREYLYEIRDRGLPPRWIGVDCCDFHRSWTRHACEVQTHNFFSDDTLLTQAAIREGLGVSFLPCYLGDPDPQLERYCDPDPANNLGMWILLHPDLKRTARVLAFRDYMIDAIAEIQGMLEGKDL